MGGRGFKYTKNIIGKLGLTLTLCKIVILHNNRFLLTHALIYCFTENMNCSVSIKNLDKIILVDDCINSLKANKRLLKREGYEVVTFQYPKEFLKYDISNTGLVICDIRMPEIDGFEVLKAIRNNDKYIPVIFLSGSYLEGKDLSNAFELGADDFITKTAGANEIVIRVRKALRAGKLIADKKHIENALSKSKYKLVELNEILTSQQRQLVQSEKIAAIGQIAAGVAHEINNPTGFVKSNIGTLKEYVGIFKKAIKYYEDLAETYKKNDIKNQHKILAEIKRLYQEEDLTFLMDDVDKLLAESCDGTEQISDIVQSLKSFARSDKDKASYCDIHDGINATLKIVWNELKYKCSVKKKYGKIPQINCYAGQLNQVWMNLLVNAAHAIPKKGDVEIETGTIKNHVYVKISDTGTGIEPKHMKKLFDPFFTTKEEGKGTGLGLSISYDIIKKHHGEIDVNSKVGKGTTFTVYLPIKGIEIHNK